MAYYDKSAYYIDFSERENLTIDEKRALEILQATYKPIERVDVLLEYIVSGKITPEDWEQMTGLPYTYGDDLY